VKFKVAKLTNNQHSFHVKNQSTPGIKYPDRDLIFSEKHFIKKVILKIKYGRKN